MPAIQPRAAGRVPGGMDLGTYSIGKHHEVEVHDDGNDRRPRLTDGFLTERPLIMLWTIAVILLVLWLLGLITSNTLGGWIYILLVVALVVIVIQAASGRRANS